MASTAWAMAVAAVCPAVPPWRVSHSGAVMAMLVSLAPPPSLGQRLALGFRGEGEHGQLDAQGQGLEHFRSVPRNGNFCKQDYGKKLSGRQQAAEADDGANAERLDEVRLGGDVGAAAGLGDMKDVVGRLCRGDEQVRLPALETNLVAHWLPVPDQRRLHLDLARVHRLILAEAALTPEDRLVPGTPVEIRHGPMTGLQGTVLRRGKSLLAAGIVAVDGVFDRGDCVIVRTLAGAEAGRGLSAYSSTDIRRIAGHKSSEIAEILGYRGRDEIIHRDDLVVTEPR